MITTTFRNVAPSPHESPPLLLASDHPQVEPGDAAVHGLKKRLDGGMYVGREAVWRVDGLEKFCIPTRWLACVQKTYTAPEKQRA